MAIDRKWGFLRETTEDAKKAGRDADTGLHRTGLNEYLEVIFPGEIWVHDKAFGEHNGECYRIRPDYRCDELMLIVEFDGVQHYQKPDRIKNDDKNHKVYETNGYKVVRIPYFIQLTNEAVEQLFGVKVNEPLFDGSIPSMGPKGNNSPAYCCPLGLIRMAEEIQWFPEQMHVNIKALEDADDDVITGVSLLKREIELMKQ